MRQSDVSSMLLAEKLPLTTSWVLHSRLMPSGSMRPGQAQAVVHDFEGVSPHGAFCPGPSTCPTLHVSPGSTMSSLSASGKVSHGDQCEDATGQAPEE